MFAVIASLGGAVIFYTRIPLPLSLPFSFQRVARWAPGIGLLLGSGLGGIDWLLGQLEMPILTRSALIVALWIGMTGALHLDGVMDSADGLGVSDREKRLEVMLDSRTGAFGAIAAIVVVLLKTTALSDINGDYRTLSLMAAAGWGRWGQLLAIALYPYAKPTGKGAIHKQHLQPRPDLTLGTLVLLLWLVAVASLWGGIVAIAGFAIALLSGYWFNRSLGGQTGDTYGAIVEVTEALLLVFITLIPPDAGGLLLL
ncbi:MAG: adenosylcobinamide-GDP ribazoletransferase [Jaaginema sp. PMC 1080.18]|nr:adenosylcobinamide-GDP ribazoletransferase [Jaaginema sp. PMC 1080.18]MEC4865544.1 adenosylcobinamide-GDP ribazoletransferase [Jaaginema sp. PMC 1078.18]